MYIHFVTKENCWFYFDREQSSAVWRHAVGTIMPSVKLKIMLTTNTSVKRRLGATERKKGLWLRRVVKWHALHCTSGRILIFILNSTPLIWHFVQIWKNIRWIMGYYQLIYWDCWLSFQHGQPELTLCWI